MEEFSDFVKKESPADEVLNVFATGAALKVKNYEITAYKSLMKLADQMGLSEAGQLFQENLTEEEDTAKELEMVSPELGQMLEA